MASVRQTMCFCVLWILTFLFQNCELSCNLNLILILIWKSILPNEHTWFATSSDKKICLIKANWKKSPLKVFLFAAWSPCNSLLPVKMLLCEYVNLSSFQSKLDLFNDFESEVSDFLKNVKFWCTPLYIKMLQAEGVGMNCKNLPTQYQFSLVKFMYNPRANEWTHSTCLQNLIVIANQVVDFTVAPTGSSADEAVNTNSLVDTPLDKAFATYDI